MRPDGAGFDEAEQPEPDGQEQSQRDELWQRAEGEPLDLEHYEAVGTMREALSRHAEEAWDELEDEVVRVVRLLQSVDRGDVGVAERGKQFRFALETCQTFFVLGDIRGQHLDGHRSIQFQVGSFQDNARAAGADDTVHFVATERAKQSAVFRRLEQPAVQ